MMRILISSLFPENLFVIFVVLVGTFCGPSMMDFGQSVRSAWNSIMELKKNEFEYILLL